MKKFLFLVIAASLILAGYTFPGYDNFTLDESTTVYGTVTTPDGPLAGVVISDGVEVAVTDGNGLYQLASQKELGYVFISVPGGFEVGSDGVRPLHYYLLNNLPSHRERVDFKLYPKANQDKFKIFMLGDMHLMVDYRDAVSQYARFTADLNSYMDAHEGENMYAVTLGDMAWDTYWYKPNNIFFPEYLDIVNAAFAGRLQFFHTMGNHDNDWKASDDFGAERPYVKYMAPTYYSFNIGRIHFVVLDDIICDGYNGTLHYSYTERITDRQLEWLRKDLSYVDKETPLIITSHATFFTPDLVNGGFMVKLSGAEEFLDIIKDYYVQIATGHTHLVFNMTPDDETARGLNVYEHNVGALCATWWSSDYHTPGVHIAKDGAPGGYEIWDIDGTDISYKFKGYDFGEDLQFRSYDLNNVCFNHESVPQMDFSNDILRTEWGVYEDFYPENSDNEVLINVWNWNSRWTVKVVDENGKELPATQVNAYDPLHILAYTAKVYNDPHLRHKPVDTTDLWHHFFKVKCDDADTDLTITVTDEFGNVYTEQMTRPKEFTTNVYAKQSLIKNNSNQ